ncbi:MAG: DUF481 domain-containing protein [Gemmatimonadales bacterium]
MPRIRGRLLTALPVVAGWLVSPLAAQVNIESLRREDPPQGLSGSLGGDVNITTGNVDLVQINANARLTHVSGLVQTLLIGQGGIGFLGRNRYASSGLLHFRKTYWYRSWVAPEWYLQADYDRALRLDYRMLGGGGIRLDFARGAWGRFGAGTSLMLEYEHLSLAADAVHDSRTTTLRNSSFLTLRVTPAGDLVVSSTTYVQPAVDHPIDDLRVLENLRVATSLTDRLQLTVTFDARYDSEPPDGISGLDTRLRTGVTYTY